MTSETLFVCVLDFEATCWENSNDHEIIEFPSVLLRWDRTINDQGEATNTIKEVSRFQTFVKPKKNPVVSKFCYSLTGISQEQVNAGIDLKKALFNHVEWIQNNTEGNKVVIATCGRWDLETMLPKDLKSTGLKMPSNVYKSFVNVKDLFKDVMKSKQMPMVPMLKELNLELEGRHHSGIDDCHNIARIVMALVEKGLTYEIFEKNIQYLAKTIAPDYN